jgi:hypothetical protein
LPTILLGWLKNINIFLGELKLKMHFNLWRFFSQMFHSWFMKTFPNLLFWKWMLLTLQ